MANLASFKSRNQTVLNYLSYNINVSNKLPWCILQFQFQINQESGSVRYQNNQMLPTYFNGFPGTLQIYFGNVLIAVGEARTTHQYYLLPQSIEFIVRLPIQAIDYIESKRTDDVQIIGTSTFYLMEMMNTQGPAGQQAIDNFIADLSFNIDLSEKKWLRLLSDMGYNEKWIIEVDRPKIEGFHEVIEHLNKATEALYNKREPEDVLRDLRSARDSFKIFYDTRKNEIYELIDRGSPGEQGRKKKSERIEEIYDSISNFLQIGPHNDKYKVTYADAQLAYREFVSVISYLSSILNEVEKS